MPTQDQLLGRIRPGDRITAEEENTKRGILRQVLTSGAGIESNAGNHIRSIAAPAGGQVWRRFLLDTESDDYVTAFLTNIDGSNPESTPTFILKPRWLQKTPWDGKTRQGIKYFYDGGDPETGEIDLFVPDFALRLAKRDGDSRQSTGDVLREREIQEVRPSYYIAGGPREVPGDDSGSDLIWAVFFEQAVGEVLGVDVNYIDANIDPKRDWYSLCVQHTPENTT